MTRRTPHPLKDWLFRRGETQAEFAERAGVAQSALSDWIGRVRHPTMAGMVRIARATGGDVMPNDLMPPGWKGDGGEAKEEKG